MKKTTSILILLAVVGGCSSFQAGPDMGDRSGYSARNYRVPGPATTSWTENDRMKNYQYAGGTPRPPAAAPATAVVAALPAPAPTPLPVDSGILPPPAPIGGAATPPALVDATPSPHTSLRPANYQEAAVDPVPTDSPPRPDLPLPQAQDTDPVPTDLIVPPPSSPLPPAKTDAASSSDGKTELVKNDSAPMPLDPTVPVKDPFRLGTHQGLTPAPSVRLVNNKRITINYEIKDVGPSGISGVELWFTQDGKTWTKRDVSTQAKPPYVIEVADEGMFGFTLLARNGIGLAKEAPKPGDLPQIWVEVDMTRPTVQLTGIHANCTSKSQNVVVRWKAADKNFGPKPITISYSEKLDGPWHVIAANLPNTGRYEWPLPPEAPARFHVKLEAIDLVGNVGTTQTPKPVLMDRAQPSVSILTVEGGK